jgi:hypothetical protein
MNFKKRNITFPKTSYKENYIEEFNDKDIENIFEIAVDLGVDPGQSHFYESIMKAVEDFSLNKSFPSSKRTLANSKIREAVEKYCSMLPRKKESFENGIIPKEIYPIEAYEILKDYDSGTIQDELGVLELLKEFMTEDAAQEFIDIINTHGIDDVNENLFGSKETEESANIAQGWFEGKLSDEQAVSDLIDLGYSEEEALSYLARGSAGTDPSDINHIQESVLEQDFKSYLDNKGLDITNYGDLYDIIEENLPDAYTTEDAVIEWNDEEGAGLSLADIRDIIKFFTNKGSSDKLQEGLITKEDYFEQYLRGKLSEDTLIDTLIDQFGLTEEEVDFYISHGYPYGSGQKGIKT